MTTLTRDIARRIFNRPKAPPFALVLSAVKKELEHFTLKPVKQIYVKFDPFHPSVESARWFLFHTSCKKVRETNPGCKIRTDIVNDRSEPSITCVLDTKEKIIIKTGNLNQLELIQLYKKHVSKQQDPPAPTLVSQLRSNYKERKKLRQKSSR